MEPKEVAKAVKKWFAGKGVKVRVKTSGGKTPWVQAWLSGDKIPNEIRAHVIKTVMPNAKIGNPDDINYGNVQDWSIALKSKEWAQVIGLKEGYTHFPSLKKLVRVNYTDPRGQSGFKVHTETEGPYIKDGKCIEGTYIMYEDEAYPGNYVAVHVSSDVSEDSGEPTVNVVAMDKNRKLVRDRLAYRRRKCKASVNEALNEFMNKADRDNRVDKGATGQYDPNVRAAIDDEFEDYPNDGEDKGLKKEWVFYEARKSHLDKINRNTQMGEKFRVNIQTRDGKKFRGKWKDYLAAETELGQQVQKMSEKAGVWDDHNRQIDDPSYFIHRFLESNVDRKNDTYPALYNKKK